MAYDRLYTLMQRALHGDLACSTMFDMDGVLTAEVCYNEPVVASYWELCTYHRNSVYWWHLHDAPPYFLPTQPVLAVVTGRMQFYQAQTKNWLERYAIEMILGLMMSQDPNPASRRGRDQDGNTAHQKAVAYSRTDAKLFIESKTWQATQIYELTKKPVLCLQDMLLYGEIEIDE